MLMGLLAQAGMIIVVGVLGVSCTSQLTSTDQGRVVGPATSSTTTTTTTTTTTLADHEQPLSTVTERSTIEDGCKSSPTATTFPGEGLETFHTLVPGTSELRFVVVATPTTVCPGGIIHLTVSIRNPTDHSLTEAPLLVMTDVYPHIVIAGLTAIDVPAGATVSVATDATVPEIPTGKHGIFVMSARSPEDATINVENPAG